MSVDPENLEGKVSSYAKAAESVARAVLCSEADSKRSVSETVLGWMVARLMRQLASECVGVQPWRSLIEDDDVLQWAVSLTYAVRDSFDGDGSEFQGWLDVARARAETFWEAYLPEIEAAVRSQAPSVPTAESAKQPKTGFAKTDAPHVC